MPRTRLSRRLEKKTRKNFLLTLIGIIVLFYLIFKLGIPLLANFSLFIAQIGKSDETNKTNQKSYIAQPILNPLPNATNSAIIDISGKAFEKQTISLYINDVLTDKQSTDEKGEFFFTETLEKGSNEIKVKAKQDGSESDYSESSIVIYENKAPELTIDTPSDGQSFSKGDNKVQVTGKTDSNTNVTVNDFWAVINENNQYTYTIILKDGENKINVVAIDQAGNKTEKTIKVNYSP